MDQEPQGMVAKFREGWEKVKGAVQPSYMAHMR